MKFRPVHINKVKRLRQRWYNTITIQHPYFNDFSAVLSKYEPDNYNMFIIIFYRLRYLALRAPERVQYKYSKLYDRYRKLHKTMIEQSLY